MAKKEQKLTPKEAAFIREYIICRNGVEAAKKAGYTGNDNTLGAIASENLRKPKIIEFMRENEIRVQEKFEITQDKIVEELALIGFGNAGQVMDLSDPTNIRLKSEEEMGVHVAFLESVTIKREAITQPKKKRKRGEPEEPEKKPEFAITELKVGTLAKEKSAALQMLGKHIGMWRPKNETGHGDREVARRNAIERIRKHLTKRTK